VLQNKEVVSVLEHAKTSDYLVTISWRDITEIGRVNRSLIDGLVKDNNIDSLMGIYNSFGKVHYLGKTSVILIHEEGDDEVDAVVIPLSQIINVTYHKSN